jgi:hypothetical protein
VVTRQGLCAPVVICQRLCPFAAQLPPSLVVVVEHGFSFVVGRYGSVSVPASETTWTLPAVVLIPVPLPVAPAKTPDPPVIV